MATSPPPTIQFRTTDLPTEFCQLPAADQLLLIRAATELYKHMKEELFVSWAATEETVQAERWREEGRREVVTEKRALAAALTAAEATAEALRATVDRRVEERVADRITMVRAECEATKMKEMLVLRERLAAAEGREKYTESLETTVSLMRDKVTSLEVRQGELNAQLLELTTPNTKSSHAIGKSGEATILEICEQSVLPHFLNARIEDMSHVGHSADFHMWLMSPIGKSVKLLIDVKKYKEAVRTKEIAKLHADVDADDDAMGGLLVSLDSQIATTKQFQIEKTKNRKTILYVILKDMDDTIRGQVMLWAVRVLSTIATEDSDDGHQHLMDNIQIFLKEINLSVRDAEMAWRACNKAAEAAKATRDGLLQRMTEFRVGTLRETPANDGSDAVEEDTQCSATKSDGKRCLNRRSGDGTTCKIHKK